MMDALKEMMAKKKSPEGKMSEQEITAKMDVIKELLDMAQKAMGDGVKGEMDGLKKVSVMAPDSESLAQGLDMAKDVATNEDPMAETHDESLEDSTEEATETPDEEKKEDQEEEFPNIFAQRREKNKRGF